MASAMMSTIPIFMNASLQRMLVKDMEAFQVKNDVYPGIYASSRTLPDSSDVNAQINVIKQFDKAVTDSYNDLGIPTLNDKTVILDDYLYVSSIEINASNQASRISVGGMSNIKDHIKITEGRMYEKGVNKNGAFEVILTEKALQITRLTIGGVYDITNVFGEMPTTKIEVVGTFDTNDQKDSYWSEGLGTEYVSSMFMEYDTFIDEGMKTGAFTVSTLNKRICMNYQDMDMTNLTSVNEKIKEQVTTYRNVGFKFTMPAMSIFEDYAVRASQLKLVMWLLHIPVMLMIIFYLFMVSKLNVEQEKNEISVFKSRGASSLQIMTIYALESLVLGAITAVIGPFVGLGFCQLLGASNGFLEFVNRKALPVQLSATAFIYALVAVAVFFVTTMIPIFPASKVSIVAHKQSKARKSKRPLWEKAFLDIILLVGSVAWVFYYYKTQENLMAKGATDTLATINPMLFVASTAFILGAGLFVVRIYPLVVRLIYKIGKRVWSPAAYVSLNNIGRSSTGRERFIMSFLILTVALGLFFANTARALNQNAVDRVSYTTGADAVLTEDWYSTAKDAEAAAGEGGVATDESGEQNESDASTLSYIEPVFERFEELEGVKTATKVFTRDGIYVSGNSVNKPANQKVVIDDKFSDNDWESMVNSRTTNTVNNMQLMTVIPDEFSKVCWFRDDLLPTHINNYLNALAEYPSGIILSSKFEGYGVKIGDKVEVGWGVNEKFQATVLAFVEYWPSINPYEKSESGEFRDFAIMNYDYVSIQTAIEPYQVWLDLEDDMDVAGFYQSFENSEIKPTSIQVNSQNVVSEKNDPMLQAMNGGLTLGFITIMIMCIIGFLIYWILSIKSRTLQFGILRAMGMSYGEIIAMIIYEQIMVSGVAVVVAIVIGGIASDVFVPVFQSMYDTIDRVPKFLVRPLRADYIKVYTIVLVMLVIGFVVLGRIISKIKISQAIKLGED